MASHKDKLLTTRVKKQRAERNGRLAELYVALRLLLTGYWPLTWRWRCPYGEIDLIVRHKSQIIFIEIKSRQQFDVSAIPSPRQRSRICRAAAHFLQEWQYYEDHSCRFDLVMVCWRPNEDSRHFHHLKNAWFC